MAEHRTGAARFGNLTIGYDPGETEDEATMVLVRAREGRREIVSVLHDDAARELWSAVVKDAELLKGLAEDCDKLRNALAVMVTRICGFLSGRVEIESGDDVIELLLQYVSDVEFKLDRHLEQGRRVREKAEGDAELKAALDATRAALEEELN